MLLSSCQLKQNQCVNNALFNHSAPATTPGYAQRVPQNTGVYLLAKFRFHTRHRIPWLVRKLLTFSRTVLHEVICLLNKYFVIFSVAVFCCLGSRIEQLNFVDARKGHKSFVIIMCYSTDTYIVHCPLSCFTVTQHFGNRLQNMFYRQCPVFSTSVSYTTLRIFYLNFYSIYGHWLPTTSAESMELKKTIEIQWWKQYIQDENYVEIVCSDPRHNCGKFYILFLIS